MVCIPRVLLPQWSPSNSAGVRYQTVSIRPNMHRPMSSCRGPIGCDRRSRSFSCVLIAVMYHNMILPRHVETVGQIVVVFSVWLSCEAIWRGIVESIWRGILESWAVFLMVVALLPLGFSAVFSAIACSGSSSCSTGCFGWVVDWVTGWVAGWVADWVTGWVTGWVACWRNLLRSWFILVLISVLISALNMAISVLSMPWNRAIMPWSWSFEMPGMSGLEVDIVMA